MLNVNSLSNSQHQQPNFKGKKLPKFLEAVKNMKCPFSSKKLSPEQKVIEQLNGAAYAMKHNDSKEVLQEVIIREGNTDFVKGINGILAKNAAMDTYKLS